MDSKKRKKSKLGDEKANKSKLATYLNQNKIENQAKLTKPIGPTMMGDKLPALVAFGIIALATLFIVVFLKHNDGTKHFAALINRII